MTYKIIFLLCAFAPFTICAQPDPSVLLGKSKIYYHPSGQAGTAVIFVSGLGEDHHTWDDVQDRISEFAMTLSYDRAGLGESEYHGEKKDAMVLANELHNLLLAVHLREPFILVGHSLGCNIIKEYAALYPKALAGLIFIDPGFDERKLRARIPDSLWHLREETLNKYIPQGNKAQQAEVEQANMTAATSDKIRDLPRVPITLFTATHVNRDFPASQVEFEVKSETHLLWLKPLPWAKHIETSLSRHYIQNDAPQLIIDAVRNMVNEVKKPQSQKI